jgi:hypothetical protein
MKKIIENIRLWYKYSTLERIYDIIRYDIWRFLANIWRFRKELWNHAWWDYHFTLQMLYRSISIMEKGMHNGYEVRQTRDKKIQKMQRLLYLLENKIDDKYVDIAEKELGSELILHEWEFKKIDRLDSNGEPLYELIDIDTPEEKEINKNIFKKAREIEEEEWNEIWEILKGQNYDDGSEQVLDVMQEKTINDNKEKDWNDWFDGTGLRGWWD